MEPSESIKEELIIHHWRMMKIDRCRKILWGGEIFEFPNGIATKVIPVGRRPVKIEVPIDLEHQVEEILEGSDYSKKQKGLKVQFSWRFGNRGDYLDLLWNLYSIGQAHF